MASLQYEVCERRAMRLMQTAMRDMDCMDIEAFEEVVRVQLCFQELRRRTARNVKLKDVIQLLLCTHGAEERVCVGAVHWVLQLNDAELEHNVDRIIPDLQRHYREDLLESLSIRNIVELFLLAKALEGMMCIPAELMD